MCGGVRGGGGVGCHPLEFFRDFERRIYSIILKLSVAVHSFLEKCLNVNHVSMLIDVAMALFDVATLS